MRKILSVPIGFLTVGCVWNLFLQYWVQGFSWGYLSLRAPWVLWIGGARKQTWLKQLSSSSSSSKEQSWPTCSYRNCPQGGSTHSCSAVIPHATRALGKVVSWAPNCAWANSQGFRFHCFFPQSSTLHPDSSHPGALLPAEGPKRLHSQEGGFSWGCQHQGTWILGDFTWSSRPEGQATIFWVHSGFWSQPGKTRQNRFKRCLMKGTLLAPIQPWDSTPPRFQGSILSQIMEVSGRKLGFTFHSCSVLYSHANPVLKYSWFAFCVCPQCTMDWFSYDVYIQHICTFSGSFAVGVIEQGRVKFSVLNIRSLWDIY